MVVAVPCASEPSAQALDNARYEHVRKSYKFMLESFPDQGPHLFVQCGE